MIRRLMKFLIRLLAWLRLLDALLLIERAFGWRRQAVVLLFHHVSENDPPTPALSKVEDGIPVRAFEAQLVAFRRWFTPCSQEALASALANPGSLRHDLFVVTFDDGYLSNRTLASPILRKHNISATVFLPTGFIESPRPFWWVRLNDIVRALTPSTLRSAAMEFTQDHVVAEVLKQGSVAEYQNRRALRVRLAERLERLSPAEVNSVLHELELYCGKPRETCLPLLKWNDVRAMRQEGFEFGAHTVTHPHMSRLTSDENQQELSLCVAEINQQLDHTPLSFAYPYGDYDADVLKETGAANFTLAYTAKPGVIRPGKTPRLELPRIQLTSDDFKTLTIFIFLLKLGKYCPQLARPILSRIVGAPFGL